MAGAVSSRRLAGADEASVRGRLRLTWLEFGIVGAVVGIVATAAVADRASRRRERRIAENEAAAIATLRLIAEAQEAFKAAAYVDVDWDGVGEYGVFRELAGSIAVRTGWDGSNTGGSVLASPLLPATFRQLDRDAAVREHGYRFKVFLPGRGGEAVEEMGIGTTDSLDGTVDLGLASTSWCAYAWPVRRDRSGRRVFFINQDAVVTSTSQRVGRLPSARPWRRRRAIDEPNAGSAFRADGAWPPYTITGTQALGTVGRDGNFWRVVE